MRQRPQGLEATSRRVIPTNVVAVAGYECYGQVVGALMVDEDGDQGHQKATGKGPDEAAWVPGQVVLAQEGDRRKVQAEATLGTRSIDTPIGP